ncbi:hypothetical protein BS47DRAFT_1376945 [Hydnum rufescens UP504]|uniref:Phosphoglycerate mutase-like protein n=1 Tax=Hydnum rufescens UP504 TaxID=1448309 RepID=A0A9P6AV70_9AGAM|nr:hypothetical protein BS47DRAFT_1376945 [Hydnum rufescens UP504]
MPLETIYIARHGFRLNFVTMEWKSLTGLARDPPLASYGVSQAMELAQYFMSLPVEQRPTAIFSSGFYRCLQTATPIAEALNIPLYVEQGCGEWYSTVTPGTGLHPRPGSASSLQKYFPLIDSRWKPTWYPSRKGETLRELHNRTASFLRAFLARQDLASIPPSSPDSPAHDNADLATDVQLELGKHKRILFLGHGASVIALAKELSGDMDMELRVGCCSLTTLVPKPNAQRSAIISSLSPSEVINAGGPKGNALLGQWDVVSKADASFLAGGVERDWGLEDVVLDGQVVSEDGVPGTEGQDEDPKDAGLQVALPKAVLDTFHISHSRL